MRDQNDPTGDSMAVKLTSKGKCPGCNNRIAKVDEKDPQRMFYKVKSMIINQDNGEVIATCSHCKTEMVMPAVKMPRKIRKKKHAPN